MEKKEAKEYKESKNKNFFVKDIIPTKHYYCITPKHLEYSSGMSLNIEEAEKKGAICDICYKESLKNGTPILSYKEHERVLLIGCKKDIKKDKGAEKELREYLLKIKDKAEKKGYVGFAFIKEGDKLHKGLK